MLQQLVRRCCQIPGRGWQELRALFRQQGIRTRILLIALIPSLLTAGLLAAQLLRQTVSEAKYNTRTELLGAARHMAAASQYALISGNLDLLHRTVEKERAQENLEVACVQDLRETVHICSGMSGFKVVINVHGDVIRFDQPTASDEGDE